MVWELRQENLHGLHQVMMGLSSPTMLGTKSKVMIEANMREKKESILKLGYRREIAKVFVDFFSNEEIDKTLIAQEIENFLDLAEC